eukprot:2697070-Pleurochrysis_carterae.AAC.1
MPLREGWRTRNGLPCDSTMNASPTRPAKCSERTGTNRFDALLGNAEHPERRNAEQRPPRGCCV